jgi:hypothetical protein
LGVGFTTTESYAPSLREKDSNPHENRAEAREIMTKLSYSAEKHLAIKVSARNIYAAE